MSRRLAAETLLLLAAAALAGCVANEEKREDVCPPNKTLVCETRMGQAEEEDCWCRNKAQMRDVFDLRRDRR